jgi:hypothetical protein
LFILNISKRLANFLLKYEIKQKKGAEPPFFSNKIHYGFGGFCGVFVVGGSSANLSGKTSFFSQENRLKPEVKIAANARRFTSLFMLLFVY